MLKLGLIDKDVLFPIGSCVLGVKPEIGEWEEVIPQGKYQHNIVLRDSSTVFMIFKFTNNDASSYNTLEKISKAIYNLGYKNEATALISSGSRGAEASYMGVFSSNGTSLTTYKVHTQKWEGTTWVLVNDTVRTLIDYNIYKRIA